MDKVSDLRPPAEQAWVIFARGIRSELSALGHSAELVEEVIRRTRPLYELLGVGQRVNVCAACLPAVRAEIERLRGAAWIERLNAEIVNCQALDL